MESCPQHDDRSLTRRPLTRRPLLDIMQEDGYSLQSVCIRAKSKGRISLASSNTHVKPSIDAGYLSNAADLATLREGIKLGRKIGQRAEWEEYLGEEVYPGTDIQTDDEIDEYIRNTVHTANALTGTCKMGTGKDCVVGPDLKVYGVNGLRVCDSSIIPVIPGGQTATPTVMVADRAAAFILNPRVTVETYTESAEPAASESAAASA
jgi:choline dehydrogenase